MKVGIIGAMDEEVVQLLEKMTNKKETMVANCSFVQGILFEKEVVLLKSGIGKVNAAMATAIMHERFSPSMVINTGSAGGFAEQLEVGDVIISSQVVHHDVDATAFNYAYGQVPGMPPMFPADTELITKATNSVKDLGINFSEGVVATGDSFIEDPNRVAFIHKKFPTMIAAEMEAAAIAQVCYQYETPFVVIRALSDIAGKKSSISFDAFLEKAAKNAAKIIMTTLKAL